MPKKIDLEDKFGQFSDHWSPRILAECNEQYVKIAKVSGDFVWHQHDNEDELFYVVKGTLFIDFRDGQAVLQAGDMIVVPRGVEHRPYTQEGEEVHVLLFEPKSTKHTGEVISDLTQQEELFL